MQVFKQADDLPNQAKTLAALSSVWLDRNDLPQSIGLARQALVLFERLNIPKSVAIQHGNLGIRLRRMGKIEESTQQALAHLVYDIVIENSEGIRGNLENLIIFIRIAAQNHTIYELPRLVELLQYTEFDALRCFLNDREEKVEEIQWLVDQLMKQAREVASDE